MLAQRAGQLLKAILADGSMLQWILQLPMEGRNGPMVGISSNSIIRLQAVPEPAAVGLAAFALLASAVYSRTSRNRSAEAAMPIGTKSRSDFRRVVVRSSLFS